MKRSILLAVAPLALAVAACRSSAATPTPAPATAAPATAAPAESMAPAGDIVATAKAAGTFGTLLKAATAAGLVETLQGRRPVHRLRSHGRRVRGAAGRTLDMLLADPGGAEAGPPLPRRLGQGHR